MKKNTKGKGSEYIGLKECFGTTTLSFTHALTGVLMSSFEGISGMGLDDSRNIFAGIIHLSG